VSFRIRMSKASCVLSVELSNGLLQDALMMPPTWQRTDPRRCFYQLESLTRGKSWLTFLGQLYLIMYSFFPGELTKNIFLLWYCLVKGLECNGVSSTCGWGGGGIIVKVQAEMQSVMGVLKKQHALIFRFYYLLTILLVKYIHQMIGRVHFDTIKETAPRRIGQRIQLSKWTISFASLAY